MALAQPELEMALVALASRDAARWVGIADRYEPEWLTSPVAVTAMEAVADVYRSTRRMSPVQVAGSLSRRGLLTAEMELYLQACQQYGAFGDAWEGIVSDLERTHQARQLHGLLTREAAALNSGDAPGEVVARLVNGALDVVRTAHSTTVTMAEAVAKAFESTELRRQGLVTVGYPAYIGALDRLLTKRLQRKAVTVVAGRPGMGKSALVQHILSANARHKGIPGLLISGEMPDEDIADRELWRASHIASQRWYRPDEWTQPETDAANKAFGDVADLPIEIYPKRRASIEQVVLECRRWKAAHPEGGLVAVDHLTTLAISERRSRTYAQAIGEIIGGLCALAEELDVAVLLACQLNREVERRDDKRPQLSDLRDSGEIEQWAQTILLLYRDEYYHAEAQQRGSEGVVEIQVAKQRQGPTDTVALAYFDAPHMSYRDLGAQEIARYASGVGKGVA